MKRIIALIAAVACLGGCSINIKNTEETTVEYTDSNIVTEESTTQLLTEIPPADPVAGVESLSAKKVVWGFGKVENHQKPGEPVSLEEKYKKLGGMWFAGNEKRICLTFDEGYENGYTPAILDTLKEKNVKAVFFVTYDFAKDNKKLIKRMLDEGHTVGNHSYHHYSMDELDTDTAKEEVAFLHRYIKDNFGYTMSYFRFPKGEFSEKSLAIVKSFGYKSVFWSWAYADWDTESQPDENEALRSICEGTHPGEILLLHAVSKTNAAILGKVIDDVRQQGYEFTTGL